MSFGSKSNPQKEPHLLFEKKRFDFVTALEKNVYGNSNQRELIYFDEKNIFFQPSSRKDHLATNFLQLLPKSKDNSSRWISIKLEFNKPSELTSKCIIDLQDENFKMLGRFDCNNILDGSDSNNILLYFEIADNIHSIRLIFTSLNDSVVILPDSIQIFQIFDEKLSKRMVYPNTETCIIDKVQSEIANLQFLTEEELAKTVANYSLGALQNYYSNDPWTLNYILNNWEFATKKTILSSFPYDIAFAISGNCNSNCIFCITKKLQKKYRNCFMGVNDWERFGQLLKFSRSIGIPGPGEPLLHPQFEELINNLSNFCDQRCNVYLITNGILINKHLNFLKKSIIKTYNISLNAASAETYQQVMGMRTNNFETVLENIRSLIALRDTEKKNIQIYTTFVVINDNSQEMSDYVKLGNKLKVDGIFLRPYVVESSALIDKKAKHDTLNPYVNPRFDKYIHDLKSIMQKSKIPVFAQPDLWNEEKINTAPHLCNLLYSKLYLHNDFYKIWPCCIIGDLGDIHPIEYDGTRDFFIAWNRPTMVNLRKSLLEGPLNECCRTCNIDLKI